MLRQREFAEDHFHGRRRGIEHLLDNRIICLTGRALEIAVLHYRDRSVRIAASPISRSDWRRQRYRHLGGRRWMLFIRSDEANDDEGDDDDETDDSKMKSA